MPPCRLPPIPTLLELVGVPEDRDARYVAKNFLGLSREAAQRMFEEYRSDFMIRYGEYLMCMAEKGFTYYLPAYIDALKNLWSSGDAEEREVIENFLRFYESEAPERHSASVTMAKIRAVWEEA